VGSAPVLFGGGVDLYPRLSAFTDFIDTLNLEDLGEDKPTDSASE
jgi:hypothetical protein